MLLAEITWLGLGLIFLFGLAMFKCTRGSCGRGSGFVAKTLGVVAVAAGVWMLAGSKHERRMVVDPEVVQDAAIENLGFGEDGPFAEGFNPLGDHFDPLGPDFDPHQFQPEARPHVGLFVLLGIGLIILGAMLFGRDKQKPFALKAITWLGIGAIIFAVANFFGEAPHADRISHRVVDARARQIEEEHAARKPSRPGRAKRPALRPERPSSTDSVNEKAELKLPPRAGSIPVEIEIAKAAAERKRALEQAAREREEAAREVEQAKAEAAREVEAAQAEAAEDVELARAEVASARAEAAEELAAAEAEREQAKDEGDADKELKKKSGAEDEKPAVAKAADEHVSIATASAADRPAWVTAGPALVDGVYRLTVASGPWSSVPECQHALDEEVMSAANEYINEYLGNPQASSLVNISPNYLRQHVRKAEFSEILDSPALGHMHQIHAQLAFDEHARADFERMWRNAVVQDRLWYIGGGSALVLALLATLYGYLKLELRTDAAGRGKLQLAATLVALIVAAGALLARWTVAF
jgi:hypothetical protein